MLLFLCLAGLVLWVAPLWGGEPIVFEDVTAACGVHRQTLPMQGGKVQADKMPVSLQDHGCPVRYRNVWLRELE